MFAPTHVRYKPQRYKKNPKYASVALLFFNIPIIFIRTVSYLTPLIVHQAGIILFRPSFRPSLHPSFHPSFRPSFHPSFRPSFHPSLVGGLSGRYREYVGTILDNTRYVIVLSSYLRIIHLSRTRAHTYAHSFVNHWRITDTRGISG